MNQVGDWVYEKQLQWQWFLSRSQHQPLLMLPCPHMVGRVEYTRNQLYYVYVYCTAIKGTKEQTISIKYFNCYRHGHFSQIRRSLGGIIFQTRILVEPGQSPSQPLFWFWINPGSVWILNLWTFLTRRQQNLFFIWSIFQRRTRSYQRWLDFILSQKSLLQWFISIISNDLFTSEYIYPVSISTDLVIIMYFI